MKRFLLSFITVSIISTTAAFGRGHEVSVTDFGARPDDGLNDAEALRAAAKYCREHRGTTLVFPPGTYDFSDPVAADIERRAINGELGRGLEVQHRLFVPQKPYVKGLDFSLCRDLTIRAAGALLRVEGWMEVLSFTKARNVVVDGLSITYKRPAATEARITAVGELSFDMEYDPDLYRYIDNVVQGRVHFYSMSKQRFYYANTGDMQLVRPGLIRVQSDARPPVGDFVIIRYGGHYRPCIMLKESKDMTVRNVTIMSFPGMGIVGHLTHNILIDGLKVVPERGRYSSTNTDATHFTSCSGTLTICNSTFKGNGDDCTNVHNYYYSIYPQSDSDKRIEIKVENADLHAQSLDYPSIGDTLVAVDRRNMAIKGRFKVKGVDTSTVKWQVIVTLDRAVSAGLADSCYMLNHTRFPHVSILNNTVYYHSARAFLLKVPHSVVSGNRIEQTTLTAIKLGAELSWREGGPVESALIENNYISHCGEEGNPSTASCVMVSTEATATPPHVNRNIIIRNNLFDSYQPFAILLQDAENVDISNNLTTTADEVKIENCRNIRINGKEKK